MLLLKMGTTEPALVAEHGDYDAWFAARLAADCTVSRAHAGEGFPPGSWDGIVLTGSPLSVRDERPWMLDAARRALAEAGQGTPVLGVCFGHQAIGEVLGGRVESHPERGELGTIAVELTEAGQADPLFDGLGDVAVVQSTHRDLLVRPPRGCVRLGGTVHTAWQAFAFGDKVRCVQFHPELPAAVLARLLALREQSAPIRETAHGSRILANWLRAVV